MNMRDTDLFQLALGLVPPWMVKACAFDAEKKRLDIEIDFARGGRFPCPCCGQRMHIIEVFARGSEPRHRPTPMRAVIRIDTS